MKKSLLGIILFSLIYSSTTFAMFTNGGRKRRGKTPLRSPSNYIPPENTAKKRKKKNLKNKKTTINNASFDSLKQIILFALSPDGKNVVHINKTLYEISLISKAFRTAALAVERIFFKGLQQCSPRVKSMKFTVLRCFFFCYDKRTLPKSDLCTFKNLLPLVPLLKGAGKTYLAEQIENKIKEITTKEIPKINGYGPRTNETLDPFYWLSIAAKFNFGIASISTHIINEYLNKTTEGQQLYSEPSSFFQTVDYDDFLDTKLDKVATIIYPESNTMNTIIASLLKSLEKNSLMSLNKTKKSFYQKRLTSLLWIKQLLIKKDFKNLESLESWIKQELGNIVKVPYE